MSTLLLIFALFSSISHITTSHTPSCTNNFASRAIKRNITRCVKLSSLGAEFGWNNVTTTNTKIENSEFDIIFWAEMESENGWVAWGVNPGKRAQMVGTRALIGIKNVDGLTMDTYNVTGLTKIGFPLSPSKIEVGVENKDVFFDSEAKHLAIYATISLPQEYNVSSLNIVWQVGHAASGLKPKMHSLTLDNTDCTDTINLTSGVVQGVGVNRQNLRKVHGILSIVGWGTILPIGVMFSRYLKRYPFQCKYWFRLHAPTQCIGYVIGFSGWMIGLILGNASYHRIFRTHRILGICIFTFTTIQMLALRLKANSRDRYRKFWNMYHHFLGYSMLATIIINIFKGIAILKPHSHKWEQAYIGILGGLGLIALGFEVFTWIKFFLQKKKKEKEKKMKEKEKEKEKATGSARTSDAERGQTTTQPRETTST